LITPCITQKILAFDDLSPLVTCNSKSLRSLVNSGHFAYDHLADFDGVKCAY
jgi:hypothetical protein